MKKICLSLVLILIFLTACANENNTNSNADSSTESSELEIESSAASSEEESEETSVKPSEEESSIASEEENAQESENENETSSEEENQEKVALILEKVWTEQNTEWITTEHRQYNDGYKLEIQRCYEPDPELETDLLLSVQTVFSQNGKYLYHYREEYNAEGEVIWRRYYTYGDLNLGERLALIDMIFDLYGYEGANQINWSEKGRDNGSFSYRNDGTFSYEFKEPNGNQTKCYYLNHQLYYCIKEVADTDDVTGYIDYYTEGMKLVSHSESEYTDYFLDNGKVLRSVTSKDDTYIFSIYLYTKPSDGAETVPELEYIGTFSRDVTRSKIWLQVLGNSVTEEKAEELAWTVLNTQKDLENRNDEWLNHYYHWNEE